MKNALTSNPRINPDPCLLRFANALRAGYAERWACKPRHKDDTSTR